MYINFSDSDISKNEELNKTKRNNIKNNSSGNLKTYAKNCNLIKLSLMNEEKIKIEIEKKKRKKEKKKK